MSIYIYGIKPNLLGSFRGYFVVCSLVSVQLKLKKLFCCFYVVAVTDLLVNSAIAPLVIKMKASCEHHVKRIMVLSVRVEETAFVADASATP